MALKEYRRKRDFGATPEPARGRRGAARRGARIFVVQLHHASNRHYDFRLELDGALRSWAVPKGPSLDPSVKRLAVEVEDHPIAYASFEGDIPQGHYGAGHVDVFDHGTWEPLGNAREDLARGELKFVLHGDVLRGSWVLVRTRRQGRQQQWLLIKHDDEYAGAREADDFVDRRTDRPIAPARRRGVWKRAAAKKDVGSKKTTSVTKAGASKKAATKKTIAMKTATRRASRLRADSPGARRAALDDAPFAPALCVSRDAPPRGDAWLHEIKWDGYRLVATVVRGRVRLWSRNGIEWTRKVPELAEAVAALRLRDAQLDGEMIVLRDGKVDFNALQGRLSAENKAPVTYMLFDVPHLDGRSLRAVPLTERKALLADLVAQHPHPALRYSEHVAGGGAAMFAQAVAAGFEGIISKRADSGYVGERSGDWIKVKRRASDEFVIVGYTEPKGSRAGIGALLLARRHGDGLVYAGRVGTGFDDTTLRTLRRQLSRGIVAAPRVDVSRLPPRERAEATWVKPALVVEVFYQSVGAQGLLRQPAFKTLRPDKTPADLAVPRGTAANEESTMDEVTITHPERVVFPGTGVSKGDVAGYYRAVASHLVPAIAGRPLSVVRCPDGIGAACFFQKHLGKGWGDHVRGVPIREKSGRKEYLCIDDVRGLLELVQMNVLEFHPWGALADDPDHADRIVFDLDPHASVAWPRVVAAARVVRRRLDAVSLASFVRTSGGKGLHVVVPLAPAEPWDAVKAFAQAVAQAMATDAPDEFVAVAGEKHRQGKIFVDYLRNGRGATSVASYSLRARAGAGVAMPLAWESLGKVDGGAAYTIENAAAFVRRRRNDPWSTLASIRQSLPRA